MGTITAAAPSTTTEAPGFNLRGFLWRSIMLGVLIGLLSGPLAIVVIGVIDGFINAATEGPPALPSWAIDPFIPTLELNVWIILAWALIAAPLGESLIFVAVYWALKRLPFGRTLFIVVMGIFAYFAHGGVPMNIAQTAGFMLLAAWYAHLARRHPSPGLFSLVKIPYAGIVLAHFTWNATAILWALGIASVAGGMSSQPLY